jgi:hypothetical protein
MDDYLYMGGSALLSLNSDNQPGLDGNPRFEHLIEIANAFEKEGIDGVRVDYSKWIDDRFFVTLLLKPESLGKRLLETIAHECNKTGHLPTVELALLIAKRVQENEGR